MPRDNFTNTTINSLAKRVGYLCSNPTCRKQTSGPHQQPEKATSIGVAAHITAAAQLGPRYDASFTDAQRSSIENGIWLCASCSTLIDKDPGNYPVALLKQWKLDTEKEALSAIQGSQSGASTKRPFLEADLIRTGGMRAPRGYSSKNPTEIDENGVLVTIIGAGSKPIIHWELTWNFTLAIHNNSSFPAINLKIETIGDAQFNSLERLRAINNLTPFSSVELKAVFSQRIESAHTEADELMKLKIPKKLEGLKLLLTYLDEDRNPHSTTVSVVNNQIINSKE